MKVFVFTDHTFQDFYVDLEGGSDGKVGSQYWLRLYFNRGNKKAPIVRFSGINNFVLTP